MIEEAHESSAAPIPPVASSSSSRDESSWYRLLLRRSLKEISTIECPHCSMSRTLYICNPQIAGVVGALVYDVQQKNSSNYLIEIYTRKDVRRSPSAAGGGDGGGRRSGRPSVGTPMTDVLPDYSSTINEERSSRERKRWQALLRNLFDHLATSRQSSARPSLTSGQDVPITSGGGPRSADGGGVGGGGGAGGVPATGGDDHPAPPHATSNTSTGMTQHLRMWRSAQMDKESFLQVFPQLPGVLGERLFAAFDSDGNGLIDFDEFASGLAVLASADLGQKLGFIFHMYDLNGDGELSRDELAMMLYHIPSSLSFLSQGRVRKLPGGGVAAAPGLRHHNQFTTLATLRALSNSGSSRMLLGGSTEDGRSSQPQRTETSGDIDTEELEDLLKGCRTEESMRAFEVMVDKLVDKAFEIYDGDGKKKCDEMTFTTFCEAVLRFPQLRLALEVFCQETIKPQSFMPIPPDVLLPKQHKQKSLFPPLGLGPRSQATRGAISGHTAGAQRTAFSDAEDRDVPPDWIWMECSSCGSTYYGVIRRGRLDDEARADLPPFFAVPRKLKKRRRGRRLAKLLKADIVSREESGAGDPSPPIVDPHKRFTNYPPCLAPHGLRVDFCGWLEKDGRRFGMKQRRFYILRDRFLYSYRTTSQRTPSRAIIIEGCRVDKTLDDPLEDYSTAAQAAKKARTIEELDTLEVQVEPPSKFDRRWGFELKWHRHTTNHTRAVLYAHTRYDRDRWIKHLSQAAGVTAGVFHDLYLLQEPLGKGKFATVYRALNRSTQEKVAVKIMRKPSGQPRKPHNVTTFSPCGLGGGSEPAPAVGGGVGNPRQSKDNDADRPHGIARLIRCGRGANSRQSTPMSRKRWCWGPWTRTTESLNQTADDDSEDDLAVQRFQRTEVAVLQLLYHPNLIRLLDVYNTHDYLYIVMEWGPSGDLRRLIDTVKQINIGLQPLTDSPSRAAENTHRAASAAAAGSPSPYTIWIPEWVAREIVRGVLSGLTFLHSPKRNVIHRDLKPDNVLLRMLIPQLKFPMHQLLPILPSLTLDVQPAESGGDRKATRAKTQVKRIVVHGSGKARSGLEWSGVRPPVAPAASPPAILVRQAENDEDETETEVAEGRLETTGAASASGSHNQNQFVSADEGILESAGSSQQPEDGSLIPRTPTEMSRQSSLDTVDMYQASSTYYGRMNNVQMNLDQSFVPPAPPPSLGGAVSPKSLSPGGMRNAMSGDLAARRRMFSKSLARGDRDNSDDPFPHREVRSGEQQHVYRNHGAGGVGMTASEGNHRFRSRRGTMSHDNLSPESTSALIDANLKRRSCAIEIMNFWLFLHCLEWREERRLETKNAVNLRKSRRSQTHQPGRAGRSSAAPQQQQQQSPEDNYNEDVPDFLQNPELVRRIKSGVERICLDLDKNLLWRIDKFLGTRLAKEAIIPKITDFGLSKIVAPPSEISGNDVRGGMTRYADEALGTAAYAAPEVLNGLKYTTSADLWSLGVVMYQLLSGGNFPLFQILRPSPSNRHEIPVSGMFDDLGRPLSSLLDVKKNYIPILRNHTVKLVFRPEPIWQKVSQAAKDLVIKLLDVNPETRITAKDALLDPWLSASFV